MTGITVQPIARRHHQHQQQQQQQPDDGVTASAPHP